MTTMLLATENLAETSTASGGSWLAAAPASDAGKYDTSKTARSTDTTLANTIIKYNHGSAKPARALYIPFHNMRSSAQIRWSRGTTDGGSQVYAGSWVNVWQFTPRVYSGRRHGCLVMMSATNSAQYDMIEFSDNGNPDGWLDVKVLLPTNIVIPTYNAEYGLRDGLKDLSGKTGADQGAVWAEERRTLRKTSFVLVHKTLSEAADFHETFRIAGVTRDVLYVPDVDDLAYSQRFGFRGTLDDMPEFEYKSFERKGAGYKLTERP